MSRILIIDDDKFVRMSIRAVLEAAGYDVDEASDAVSGLSLQKSCNFDAVIVDLIMPQQDGLETIKELKANNPDLPIVAISGGGVFVRKNFVSSAVLFGANATLEKPFEGDELLGAIAKIVVTDSSAA
ncbi:MAG: response regulator [Magnetovibrio sp.]|nr:response regulator [Magnetovibrio sp.]